FFQAEDGIRDYKVTGVQTCALPIFMTDQLKIETIARSRRTSLPAMVACSNAKSKPPAAINESISASPAELLADSDQSERVSRVRSEERRVGKEWRCREVTGHVKKRE